MQEELNMYKKYTLDCSYVKGEITKYGTFELDTLENLKKQIYDITNGGIFLKKIRCKVLV